MDATCPRWSAAQWRQALVQMPKAHLHLHLSGACPPGLWEGWAGGGRPPRPRLAPGQGFEQFESQLRRARQVLVQRGSLPGLLQALGGQSAAQGVCWVELAVDPLGWPESWTRPQEWARAAQEWSQRWGVGLGVVSLARRAGDPGDQTALQWALQLAEREVAVSLGLAGDELARPIRDFDPLARAARAAGLGWVPHVGEIPGSHPEVGRALAQQPQRLAHGWAAAGDPALMADLAARRVCLDLAPASNRRLGVVARLPLHPARRLVAAGVPISVSGDNPLLVGHDLVAELALAGRFLGLGPRGVAWAGLCSLRAAQAPEALHDRWEARWAGWAVRWGLLGGQPGQPLDRRLGVGAGWRDQDRSDTLTPPYTPG